jgi:hypothetical protein
MGLDQAVLKMSLETAAKIGAWQSAGRDGDVDPAEGGEMETIWVGRKENHIHAAIADITHSKVRNCDYLLLSKENVQSLVTRLATVHAEPTSAQAVLPPQEGFFFGGTDINEWYFKDIEQELEDFTAILNEWDESSCYAYWAWW